MLRQLALSSRFRVSTTTSLSRRLAPSVSRIRALNPSISRAQSTSTTATTPSTDTCAQQRDNKEQFPEFFHHDGAFQVPEGGNVTKSVLEKIGRNLHLERNHPVGILKGMVQAYFEEKNSAAAGEDHNQPLFTFHDDLHPKVTVKQNFDDLLFPPNHVARRPTDTYYFDNEYLLRTHTTAHQVELLEKGERAFLIAGDVYRRDEIDATHYNVFHQLDGVRVFRRSVYDDLVRRGVITGDDAECGLEEFVLRELKRDLEGVARKIFGDLQMQWVDAYFPFTYPSIELEILYNDKWMEVLGCGVIQRKILENAGLDTDEYCGYAFGIGLERLAMKLFEIPDIRLFWTTDKRFINQFKEGQITKFEPYSKYPPCYKDISFWIPDKWNDNDFYEVVRDVAGDLVEEVIVEDEFTHPKTQRTSKCFRIMYRSMERTLTNEEIDEIQFRLRDVVSERLNVELR